MKYADMGLNLGTFIEAITNFQHISKLGNKIQNLSTVGSLFFQLTL